MEDSDLGNDLSGVNLGSWTDMRSKPTGIPSEAKPVPPDIIGDYYYAGTSYKPAKINTWNEKSITDPRGNTLLFESDDILYKKDGYFAPSNFNQLVGKCINQQVMRIDLRDPGKNTVFEEPFAWVVTSACQQNPGTAPKDRLGQLIPQ